MTTCRRILPAFFLLLLSGCAGDGCGCPKTATAPENILRDPDDVVLDRAMRDMLSETDMPQSSRFQYVRVDLDEDGRRDALVLMAAPFETWCDVYGCTLYVMKARNEGFEAISKIRPVRTPLTVGETRSNGWRDLILRIDGRWSHSHEVALRFDGTTYPSAPEGEPPLPGYLIAAAGGMRVFP